MNSQTAKDYREDTIVAFLRQCTLDDIQNIQLPENTHHVVYEFLDNLIQKYCNSNTDFNILDYLKTNDIDINDMFGNATDVINCIQEIKDNFLEFTKKVPDEFTRSSFDLSMDSDMTLEKRILQLYTYVWLKDWLDHDDESVLQFFEFEKVVVDDEHVTIRLAPHLETYRQNKLREFGVNAEEYNAPRGE